MYKIIGADQKEYGPVSAEQIRQWLAQGRLNRQSRAQAEGDTNWKPLWELPEFADELKVPPPPPSSVAAAPTAGKTSGMAIASLVLGIAGMFTCGVTALVGLVLGIISLIKIPKSNGALRGWGIALAGTIVSALFLLVMPVYAGLFIPALANAKQKTQEINCVNNLKQLALAVRIYASDNDDKYPTAATWCDLIQADVGSARVFQCPAADKDQRCHYAYNAKLSGLEEDKINTNTVLFVEADGSWNQSGGPELMLPKPRHRRFVVAFADGRVERFTPAQISQLRWDP